MENTDQADNPEEDEGRDRDTNDVETRAVDSTNNPEEKPNEEAS